MFKICKKCNKELEISLFSLDNKSKDKKKRYCKACSNDYYSSWRNSKLEEIRKKDKIKHYIRKYNFSLDDAEALVENRKGICEICQTFSLLVVDHCHKTNKVRGLICSSCNSALGYSKEDCEILINLIKYINKHV